MTDQKRVEQRVRNLNDALRKVTEYEKVVLDLQQSRSELQDQIALLENFQQVVVGRELKMIELEKEIERSSSGREKG